MDIMVYPCGCSIFRSMFGEREVIDVSHCKEHFYLSLKGKNVPEMAEELIEKMKDWRA